MTDSTMTDCLIIGYNDFPFADYVDMLKAMGTQSGAYRDLNLAFVEHGGKPYRSMDLLNHFHFEGKDSADKPFHNTDFLWPVVMYLGTFLSRRGFAFDYVNLFHMEQDALKHRLLHDRILTIAITTTLYVIPHPILDIISFIRKYNQTARIIVGGPYVSNQVRTLGPDEAKQLFRDIGADFYVIGQEGEQALADILRALKHNLPLRGINNIAYWQDEDYVITQPAIENNSLTDNMIDYTLFRPEDFGEFITLRTAKSCPFSCSFCGFPQRAGKYTYMDVECVERELNGIRDLDRITTLTFIDDTFNVPKKRFKDILRMMIRNGYDFKWNCFYRSDHGDEETIELMKMAGCEGVFLGVESGSDAMLQRMNKTARRKDYLKAIPLFREMGISTYASLIVGFPGETEATIHETIDLIEDTKPDFFRAQLWYCDPITPIWARKLEYGIQGSAFNWSHNTMDSKTACDWIDRIFLTVENSLWLPQHGFEQWSTFYLQRKGMSMSHIKAFVRCFNAAVKEKLVHRSSTSIDRALLATLAGISRFDQPREVDLTPIDRFSGSRYLAAERFWLEEFKPGHPTSNITTLRLEPQADEDEWGSVALEVETSILSGVAQTYRIALPDVVLAAYSVFLSRLSGNEVTAMVVGFHHCQPECVAPMGLRPSHDLTFIQFACQVEQKRLMAVEHQQYAFRVVADPLHLDMHGRPSPRFDVAYLYQEDVPNEAEMSLDPTLTFPHVVRQGIGIVLGVTNASGQVGLTLFYKRGWFRDVTMQDFASYFGSILLAISASPEITLAHLGVTREAKDYSDIFADDAGETFQF